MLDNDDNSNRLISTYSSEGSNLSWHEGCEGWRPTPPHTTHLFILDYMKQLWKWIYCRILMALIQYYIIMETIWNKKEHIKSWIIQMYQNKHTRVKILRR
jgi:hypothetical protein